MGGAGESIAHTVSVYSPGDVINSADVTAPSFWTSILCIIGLPDI